ncbi:MAG: amidohydrolase family protein [Acidimicrobiales bacterium]
MSTATAPIVDRPIISADSHITEPPECYVDNIDPKFRDRAPHVVRDERKGDMFVVPGMSKPLTVSLSSAAGIPPEDLRETGRTFDDFHRSGYDPETRAADQDRDGVAGEIIYPTVGMILCNHKDHEYKQACFEAYNRWISGYCAHDPSRLYGLGQTAALSVEQAITDLETMKELGLRGVMMPGYPGDAYNRNTPDYDDPYWDPFYRASVELGMPLGFHILTMGSQRHRGPKSASFMSIIRGNQDVIAMMVMGGVFERNPELVIACTEADAGWVPHFMYRMDHAVKRHGTWMKSTLSRLPSEYCLDHVRLTFQDDWVAFKMCRLDDTPIHKMLMWANDFPHSDSTWPWSQEVLAEHTSVLTDEEKRAILHDNVAELYGL